MIVKRIRIVLFICYIFFILLATIFSRHSTGEHMIEMRLMWSYRAMLARNPNWKVYVWQNIENILLFIPFGFLFPIVKYRVVLISGLTLSVIIEIIQYIACLGLCELDDVLCNGVGALVGCMILNHLKNDKEQNFKQLR